jgi:Zn-dependent protease
MMWQILAFESGLAQGVALFVAFVVAVVLHEVAHGVAAFRLGDPTAKLAGRLTLNPLAHADLWGTVVIPILLYVSQVGIIFGWAKPVPVNYYNLRGGRWGPVLVALAGPAMNLLLLIVMALAARFSPAGTQFPAFFLTIALINGVLMLFNLIPIPPLDGSKILYLFLDNRPDIIQWLERYSFFILLGVLLLAQGLLTRLIFLPTLFLTSWFSGFAPVSILGLLS